MTTNAQNPKAQYTGNGMAAIFAVPFAFNAHSDLVITLTDIASNKDTLQVLESDYIVAGGGGGAGSVAMMSAPVAGQQLTITLAPSALSGVEAAVNKTEAQMRAAAMLLVIELSLSDIYAGRVSSTGTLWDRKIFVRLNDLEYMVIDFTGSEGIRTYMVRTTDQADGGKAITPLADFKVNTAASLEGVQAFIQDLVIITADSVVMDPVVLVHKIAEVANNASRLQQAASNLDNAPAPSTYQPT